MLKRIISLTPELFLLSGISLNIKYGFQTASGLLYSSSFIGILYKYNISRYLQKITTEVDEKDMNIIVSIIHKTLKTDLKKFPEIGKYLDDNLYFSNILFDRIPDLERKLKLYSEEELIESIDKKYIYTSEIRNIEKDFHAIIKSKFIFNNLKYNWFDTLDIEIKKPYKKYIVLIKK